MNMVIAWHMSIASITILIIELNHENKVNSHIKTMAPAMPSCEWMVWLALVRRSVRELLILSNKIVFL